MNTFSKYKKIATCLLMLLGSQFAWAANPAVVAPAVSQQDLLLMMGGVALILLIIIVLLMAFPFLYGKKGGNATKLMMVGFLLSVGTYSSATAQTVAVADSAQASSDTFKKVLEGGVAAAWSVFDVAYWSLFLIIALECFVILSMVGKFLYGFYLASLAKENETRVAMGKSQLSVWDRINDSKTIEEERDVQLDHNYDGIKELDNSLPPWWIYGFYATILFSAIYIWRYHIVHTAPLPHQELSISIDKGEQEVAAYLKKSANAIDENTVKLLTDGSALATGKGIFTSKCAVCHGQNGEGAIGPNFTDDYWLHGGSIKDIFKTVKYGVIEKGMKSWKEELSPSQIAQVGSYIKSLKGTNPANPKEPQGDLYQEGGDATATTPAATPTTPAAPDSTKKK